jgi:hypothetical protein
VHVALQAVVVVDPARQPLGHPHGHVHHRDLAEVANQVVERAGDAQGHQRRFPRQAPVVRPQQRLQRRVRDRGRQRLVEDAHHLLGCDAVGNHAGDERPRAGADVDVEVVDRAVHGEEIQRAKRADLVDAAGEPSAAEDERGLVPAPAGTTT